MNLQNTKLDLSEYSEEEREIIVKAYADACGKKLKFNTFCIRYYCNPTKLSIITTANEESNFEERQLTEVKPVLQASWQPIKSIDDLKVGDVVNNAPGYEDVVAYVGANVVVVNKENDDGDYVITRDIRNVKKKITTYTFGPVIDDTFAIECYETFSKQSPHTMLPWAVLHECSKQAWRTVAALKLKGK